MLMKDKYKNLLGNYIFCIISTLLIAFFYYQFVQKPQIIKKVCDNQAIYSSVFGGPENKIPNEKQREIIQNDLYRKYYENCVIMNGEKL